jgi:hypothetical protein
MFTAGQALFRSGLLLLGWWSMQRDLGGSAGPVYSAPVVAIIYSHPAGWLFVCFGQLFRLE